MFRGIVIFIFIILYILGLILHAISKIPLSLGLLLMLNPDSALDELKNAFNPHITLKDRFRSYKME